MANKTFTVECTMEERWIPEFYMFLAKMQTNGEMGHSELLGFYSDGDGDFRPTFKFSISSPEGPIPIMDRKEMIDRYKDSAVKIETSPRAIPSWTFDAG